LVLSLARLIPGLAIAQSEAPVVLVPENFSWCLKVCCLSVSGKLSTNRRLVAIPTGAVCVIPANVPHYVAAKEGDVIYQEAGVGVTETMFMVEAGPP
jgi:hypothetical protein